MNFDIEKIMKSIKNDKRMFCSEADFQHTLAWKIKEEYSQIIDEIILEYPFSISQDTNPFDKHLDILVVFKNGKLMPIELKYKLTYKGANSKNDIGYKTYNYKNIYSFKVKDQGARNQGCYKYIKDIKRIEEFKKDNPDKFYKGYAIILTNEIGYQKKPKDSCDYYAFSLYQGRKDLGSKPMNWPSTSSSYREEDTKISLDTLYPEINWLTSYEINDFGTFYYLVTTIK